jgi:SAM-dependent methyltransferase
VRRSLANFDQIAPFYRALEYVTLGRALERTLFRFLPELLNARRALVLGDGDGRFLAKLLEANTSLHATAVDTSNDMLQLLRQRCASFEARLETEQANARSFCDSDTEHYDLIVTHFFLDCLGQSEVEALVRSIRLRLEPGALWVLSEFHVPDGVMRVPARIMIRGLYFAFRVLTGLQAMQLPDYSAALADAGFTRMKCQLSLGGMLTAELWQLGEGAVTERIPTFRSSVI